MANFLRVWLFLVTFLSVTTLLYSAPTTYDSSYGLEACDAPAPDSFRVTSAGGNFISLSWKPVWPGASYFLVASEKNSNGGWIPTQIFPDVQDTNFTVTGIEGGKEYRFYLSTKCVDGSVSSLTAWVDAIGLIVDLTLLGRTPKNPEQINNLGIPYQSYHWLGFRVTGEGGTGLFEVQVNDVDEIPLAWIRRVNLEDKIVAVNSQGIFPNLFLPEVTGVQLPFEIVHIHQNANNSVGFINIIKKSDPPSIDIDISSSWKPNYDFKVLKADNTILIPPGNGTGQGFQINKRKLKFHTSFENPFSEQLNIFLTSDAVNETKIAISLYNSMNQHIETQISNSTIKNCSFNTSELPIGVYFLVIENDHIFEIHKLIKL